MQIFTQEELQAAKNHKYSGTDDSLLVRFCFKYIWNWMVEQFPMWLAPNVITFTGFLFEVVSFIISFIESDFMRQPLPGWVCILDGVFLLIYQTLDNLDGKQARRTGSSSSLGQFFDHGCDAITGCLELMKVAMVMDFGPTKKTFIFISCMGIGFLLTTWEEFCTHKFYLGYLNGPDEGLFLLGVAQIVAGINPGIKKLVDTDFFNYGFLFFFGLTLLLIFYDVFKEICFDAGRVWECLLAVFPCFITFGLFLAHGITTDFKNISPYFIMLCGLILQFGGQMIIVAILTCRPAKRLYSAVVIIEWLALCVPFIPNFSLSEFYWFCFFWIHILIMIFTDLQVVYSLSSGLGIPIFTIKPMQQAPETNDQLEIINVEEDHESFEAEADPDQVNDMETKDA